uniref:RNA-directed DNA polymerase, eukaryota n=1 Tax=Tanacetum cinerariifolium TaxID=118510 RepID=A0A699HLB4_TANCI|nr:RNA-directed DNA polymerase, eukaryota [Tanacetum cinerariifolium]
MTKQEDNILEKFKIIVQGKNFVIRAKELFVWSPMFKEDKEVVYCTDDESVKGSGEDKGGASKNVISDTESDGEGVSDTYFGENEDNLGFTPEKENYKVGVQEVKDKNFESSHCRSEDLCSRVLEDGQHTDDHFSSVDCTNGHKSKKWGSILEVLDDMIKVIHTMGYDMEGCMKDMENIIGSQGDRHLSDHRPILLRDVIADYGATPFRLYHSWLSLSGFEHMVTHAWNSITLDDRNRMLDQGGVSDDIILSRMDLMKQLQEIKSSNAHDFLQKAKIQWSIEGDENSKFFHDEIRNAVWACGENKSPGLDGFTFEFYRKFWGTIGPDLCLAVQWFFNHSPFSMGCNSSFIVLILKVHDPKFVSDYRPISLIGSLYKVVTKILAIRLSSVIVDLISDVQTAFLPHRQILDGPFIINELLSCLSLGMASILFNGSLKSEFQFPCDAGIFKGIKIGNSITISRLFYVDDAVFVGLKINDKKSHLLGVGTSNDKIIAASSNLGCSVMKTPFKYLGVMVGGNMSNVIAWDDIICKVKSLLSKWKLKTLSIGGRLMLLKSVLGSTPIFWMSVYKVPKYVLSSMEAIHRNFFNGAQGNEKKITWVKWTKRGSRISTTCAPSGAYRVYDFGNAEDKWYWDLNGSEAFCVKDVRNMLDESFLPKDNIVTRWIKFIPIKINVFAWKVYLDRLLTRPNLLHRGVHVPSLSSLICSSALEDTSHLLFSCGMASDVVRLVCRWWDLVWTPLGSYSERLLWFNSIRLGSKSRAILEGVFYVTWWCLWNFRNQLLFAAQKPRKDVIFDDIVVRSFSWCSARCKSTFTWDSWLQHPSLISL